MVTSDMPLEIVTVPCRTDNYAFLLHNADTGQTALVDAPEVPAIEAALKVRGWELSDILITHHHGDHIDGVEALRAMSGARVIGAAADAHRLPPLDLALTEGDVVMVCDEAASVIDVSGHTLGHIAFHFAASHAAFTADSLMAMGCGRLFEGTAAQMWASMQKLRALPPDTLICSGHEYTANNARFALTIEPGNPDLIDRVAAITAARAEGRFTVPSVLALEQRTNPFLRADDPALAAAIGMTGVAAADIFAEVRRRKDKF
jgi:hydroxyacylglutathione hydrolase